MWTCMADVFTSESGKRLFGFLSAGATLGEAKQPCLSRTAWV